MRLSKLFPILILVGFINARPAPESHDSPRGADYIADFYVGEFSGYLSVHTVDGHARVLITMDGFAPEGAPYSYRIHEKPVPSEEDCDSAGGVFDPYHGAINATTPAEFRIGDLSGKHGNVSEKSIATYYDDMYLSLNPRNPEYVGKRSMVISDNKGTRVVCANFFQATEFLKVPANVSPKVKKEAEKLLKKLKKCG